MFLYDKHFFAPYFIFIKIGENIDYNEVLNRLGLRNVEEIEFKPTHQNPKEVYVTRCKNWVHVMDNWFYDLYHSNLFSTITQLNTEGYDIYRCSIGDSDNSYAFSWYRKGVLVREFTYDDMKGRVIRDIGPPLEGEKEKHHKKND